MKQRIAQCAFPVLLFICVTGCANRIILKPQPPVPPPPSVLIRMVNTPAGSVEVWIIRSLACIDKPPQAFVLEIPGKGGVDEQTVQSSIARWRNWPVEIWACNYPGYGRSSARRELGAIPQSLLAVFDELPNSGNHRSVIISGTSLGTTGAVYLSLKRPSTGVILLNPIPIRELIMKKWGWRSLWIGAGLVCLQVPDELNLPQTSLRATSPACILVADKDIDVPKSLHDLIPKSYAGQKTIVHMTNEDHNSGVDCNAEAEVQKWIDIVLKSSLTK